MKLHASAKRITPLYVIPAKAGIQEERVFWTPAFAGVTTKRASFQALKFLGSIKLAASAASG